MNVLKFIVKMTLSFDKFDFQMSRADTDMVDRIARNKSQENFEQQQRQLSHQGYTIVKKALLYNEVVDTKRMFNQWSMDIDRDIYTVGQHSYKYQVAHTPFNWYIRTRNGVVNPFKKHWNSLMLASSFACPRLWNGASFNNVWDRRGFHVDQDPKSDIRGYCGYVSLTDNHLSGIEIIPQSHKRHHEIKRYPISDTWANVGGHLDIYWDIEKGKQRRGVKVFLKAGEMLLYDSRLTYRLVHSEEEIFHLPVSYYPESENPERIRAYKHCVGTTNFPFPFAEAKDQKISVNDNSQYLGIEVTDVEKLVYGN